MRSRFVTAWSALIVCIGSSLTACTRSVDDNKIKYIEAGDLRQMMSVGATRPDYLFLIDPRSEREYAEGHISGAEHITIDRVVGESSPRNPPFGRYTHVVVYGNDPASAPAKGMVKRILSLGHKHTRMYTGGMKEWADTYPSLVEKAEPAADAN